MNKLNLMLMGAFFNNPSKVDYGGLTKDLTNY